MNEQLFTERQSKDKDDDDDDDDAIVSGGDKRMMIEQQDAWKIVGSPSRRSSCLSTPTTPFGSTRSRSSTTFEYDKKWESVRWDSIDFLDGSWLKTTSPSSSSDIYYMPTVRQHRSLSFTMGQDYHFEQQQQQQRDASVLATMQQDDFFGRARSQSSSTLLYPKPLWLPSQQQQQQQRRRASEQQDRLWSLERRQGLLSSNECATGFADIFPHVFPPPIDPVSTSP